jgi:hypothetical protein
VRSWCGKGRRRSTPEATCNGWRPMPAGWGGEQSWRGELNPRADRASPLTGENADCCVLDDAGVAAVIEFGIDNVKDPNSNRRGNNGFHPGPSHPNHRCSANLVRSSGLKWDRATGLRSARCVGGAPGFSRRPDCPKPTPRGAAIGLGAGKRSVGDVKNSRLRSRLTRARRFTLAGRVR